MDIDYNKIAEEVKLFQQGLINKYGVLLKVFNRPTMDLFPATQEDRRVWGVDIEKVDSEVMERENKGKKPDVKSKVTPKVTRQPTKADVTGLSGIGGVDVSKI